MILTIGEGRVAKDAKVFSYGQGKTGVSVGVICNKYYGDEEPTYIQVTKFGADQSLGDLITTGRQIFFQGDLSRNEEGYYSVIAKEITLGQLPNGSGERSGNSRSAGAEREYQDNGRQRDYNDGKGTREFLNIPDGIGEELPRD